MKKIAIIGGGIGGLTAAWLLHKRAAVTLFEKSARLGGWIATVEREGFLFERGPRGFRPKGKGEKTLQLCHELGLKPIPATLSAKKRYLLLGGRLKKVSLLTMMAHLPALLRDLTTPACTHEESIGAFFQRRFGRRFTDTFIDPLVSGIFGGNLWELSLPACLPQLKAWEHTYGSLSRGYFANRKKSPLPPLLTFEGGMESLPLALAEQLSSKIAIHLSSPVRQEELTSFDEVIATTPTSLIPYATITVVNLGWKGDILPLQAFGYLVPSKEGEEILGVTFDSAVFPQHKGKSRLCVMLRGEKKDPLPLALEALARHLRIKAAPDAIDVTVAKDAIPQYLVGGPPLPPCGSRVGVNETIAHIFNSFSS